MEKPIMSPKKAQALSLALFLVGLAILTYINSWWPAITLVVGLPIALRQYLVGKIFDMIISLIVFLGIFITVQFHVKWDILLPLFFAIGGVYIFSKEFFKKDGSKTEVKKEDKIEK
jgi:predicted membrane protein